MRSPGYFSLYIMFSESFMALKIVPNLGMWWGWYRSPYCDASHSNLFSNREFLQWFKNCYTIFLVSSFKASTSKKSLIYCNLRLLKPLHTPINHLKNNLQSFIKIRRVNLPDFTNVWEEALQTFFNDGLFNSCIRYYTHGIVLDWSHIIVY